MFFLDGSREKNKRSYVENSQERCAPRLPKVGYSFSQRVINNWNALPAEAVLYTTVNSFNGKITPLVQHIWWSYMIGF